MRATSQTADMSEGTKMQPTIEEHEQVTAITTLGMKTMDATSTISPTDATSTVSTNEMPHPSTREFLISGEFLPYPYQAQNTNNTDVFTKERDHLRFHAIVKAIDTKGNKSINSKTENLFSDLEPLLERELSIKTN